MDQNIIIPVMGMLTGIIIPLAVFFWLYHEDKGKRETVLEISKNLDDPEKLDLILQEHGYGKAGEVLHKFEVPEAVTPLEETLRSERSKSIFEYFVESIIGTNDKSQ